MIRVISLVVAIALVIAAVVVVVAVRRSDLHPLTIPMASIEDLYALDRDSAIVVWSAKGKTRLTRSDTTGKPIWTHEFNEAHYSETWQVTLLKTVLVFDWGKSGDSPFTVISFDGKRWDQVRKTTRDDEHHYSDYFYETRNHILRVLFSSETGRMISYDKRTGAIAWEREWTFDTINAHVRGDGLIDGRGVFVDARDGKEVALGSGGCSAGQTYVRVEDQRMYLYREEGLVPTVLAFPFPHFAYRCGMLRDHLVVIGFDGPVDGTHDSYAAIIEGDVVKHTFHLGRGVESPEVSGYTARFVPYRQSAGFSTVDLETGAVVLHPDHQIDAYPEVPEQYSTQAAQVGPRRYGGRTWVFNGPGGLRSFDGETGRFGTTKPRLDNLWAHHVRADRIWRFDRAPAPDGLWPWPGLQVLDAVTLEPVQPPAIDTKSRASNPAAP